MAGGPPHTNPVERHASYTSDRGELLSLLPPSLSGAALDVGCSTGAVGRRLKEVSGGRLTVTGIELDGDYATQAATVLDECLNMDAAAGIRVLQDGGRMFDVVVLADILEHLEDPWSTFDDVLRLVRPGGGVLVSLPNVGHWNTIANLLRGRWPRRSRGIHDSTHLRFFARRDVEDLMNRGPARLVGYRRVYRLTERPLDVNRFARFIAWTMPDLFTYQFHALSVVGAEMADSGGRPVRMKRFAGGRDPGREPAR